MKWQTENTWMRVFNPFCVENYRSLRLKISPKATESRTVKLKIGTTISGGHIFDGLCNHLWLDNRQALGTPRSYKLIKMPTLPSERACMQQHNRAHSSNISKWQTFNLRHSVVCISHQHTHTKTPCTIWMQSRRIRKKETPCHRWNTNKSHAHTLFLH